MRNEKLVSGLAICVVSLLTLCTLASAPHAAGASFAPSWEEESPMLANATQAVVVQDVDGIVYSISGVVGLVGGSYGAVVPDSYKFDPATGVWTEIAPIPIGVRGAAGAMGLDGKVYVFGGVNTTLDAIDDTQIYDPATDTWGSGSAAPAPLWESKAAPGVYEDEILVVGGEGLGSSLYTYDSEGDSWTARAAAPTPVLAGAFVKDGSDYYYIGGGVGGYAASDIVYRYSYWGDSWDILGSMPVPLVSHSAILGYDDLIYVAGGGPFATNIDSAYNTSFCFDPDADEWTQLEDIPTASKYLGMTGSPDGTIYVFGGNNESAVFDQVASLQIFRSSVSLSKTVLSAGESFTVTVNVDLAFVAPDGGMQYYALIMGEDDVPQNPVYGWVDGEFSSVAFDMTVPVAAEVGDYRVMLTWYLDTDVGSIESGWVELAFSVADSYTVEEQISMMEENLTTLQDALADQADAQAEQIAALQSLADALQSALDALAADVDTNDAALMADIAALEAQIEDLNDMLGALQSSVDDNQGSLDGLEDSVDGLQNAVDGLGNSTEEVQSSVDSKMDSVLGFAMIGLLVVVLVLLLVMMVMGRRAVPPPPKS